MEGEVVDKRVLRNGFGESMPGLFNEDSGGRNLMEKFPF